MAKGKGSQGGRTKVSKPAAKKERSAGGKKAAPGKKAAAGKKAATGEKAVTGKKARGKKVFKSKRKAWTDEEEGDEGGGADAGEDEEEGEEGGGADAGGDAIGDDAEEEEGGGDGAGGKARFSAAEVYAMLKLLRLASQAWQVYDAARAKGKKALQNAFSALVEMETRKASVSRRDIVTARVNCVWGVCSSAKRPAFGRMIEAVAMNTEGSVLQARNEKVWSRKIAELSKRYNVRSPKLRAPPPPSVLMLTTYAKHLCKHVSAGGRASPRRNGRRVRPRLRVQREEGGPGLGTQKRGGRN